MTTDMERELRELFREKAGEAPTRDLDTPGPRRRRSCGAAAAARWEPSSARPRSSSC